ncbi:gp069 [Rhodococcus phage ReqiPoco6]|uniref:Gp069 n=1 Tax=Rhodococcus phage ReqiPoco6 TaxID=691964 RepID=D4P7T7_9CAUD|nr:gp069 [Rhodococcus phage ReqiPoco6]ADD81067.1 gp069 [Rhodococcus phage ReqiPoco6]
MSIKNTIMSAGGKNMAMTMLKLQKNSPTILFGAGVVGVVGTVVLASRATLKVSDIVDEASKNLETINANAGSEEYSAEDAVKDKGVVYVKTALDVTKLYGPAFILGVASIGCLAGSHNILTRRNAALGAAYAGVEKAFREYRGRVIDEIGEEKEARIYQPVEEVDAVDAEGKKTKVSVPTAVGGSPYKRIFDESNKNWNKQTEFNQMFIRTQQNYANDMLRARGYLFLNDVYEMLGIERSKEGQIVGWALPENGSMGDGYVDFGVFSNVHQGMKFVMGDERSIWLDFNVDGNILEFV